MGASDSVHRAALIEALQQHVRRLTGTQSTKAKTLSITQPRLSDLMRGRVEKFSLDALVALSKKAGLQLNVNARSVPFQRSVSSIRPVRRMRSKSLLDPREFGRLNIADASQLFLKLLRCEVLAAGLSPKSVTLSNSTTTADGGIDAKVMGVPRRQGLLPAGDTHFQIKTGTAFKPWQPAQIRKEILGASGRKPSPKMLGAAIKECLDRDGLYCLLTFGYDLIPQQQTESEKHLIELFQACGYSKPRVSVLGQGHIAGEIEEFPSLYCDLVGFEQDRFQSYREWRESPAMTVPFQVGQEQLDAIYKIREVLLRDAPTHIRLVGEPGIGKTRLTLEALSVEELASSVLYVPTGEDFQKSQLFKSILRLDHPFFLILVIDDCDDADRASILAALQSNRNVRLLTIDHGYARGIDSAVEVIQCPRLSNADILAILSIYVDASNSDLGKWVELCEGSPRVAHAVGENLKNNPNDILRPPASVPLWERFISGFAKLDSRVAREHKLVLLYIALFFRFGFEHPVSEEAHFIAEEVRAADPAITWPRFQAIVRHFQDRRILQGRHTLFLVPKALHIYLWVEFWNQHGRDFNFDGFVERMPRSMRDWFLRLFTYAHQVPPALAVVKQLLSPQGLLSQGNSPSSSTTPRLVRYLAEADPHATLSYIERTYGSWSHADLLAWKEGRQDIVWALEFIAVWADYFERTVRVLVKMAVAENATNSNNARGTLVGLFSIGIGWAATQAAPEQRFSALRRLLVSQDEAMHKLGLDLAESWLSTHGGSRIVGPEHQGLRPTIEFWRPKTYGEVFDAWRKVWRLLEQELQGAPPSRRDGIAAKLVSSAHGLIPIPSLAEEVLETLTGLCRAIDLDKKPLIALVINLIRNRHVELPKGIVTNLRSLDSLLTGSSLWEHIVRYTIYSDWNEDYDFSDGEARPSVLPEERIAQLAKELMSSRQVFEEHLGRLLRATGHRLAHLGVACGRLATDRSWDDLLSREVSGGGEGIGGEYIGGYLAGLREKDADRWERYLLSMFDNASLRKTAVECAWRSGVSESVLDRMVALYKLGSIESGAFNQFIFRPSANAANEASLGKVIDALLEGTDGKAHAISVELLYGYYAARASAESLPVSMPKDRPLKALIKSAPTLGNSEPMRDFYWGQLARRFITTYPDESLTLLRAAVASAGALGFSHSETSKVFMEILKAKPVESWEVVAELLDLDDANSFRVGRWLMGEIFEERQSEPGPASQFPIDAVIDWIKVDPAKRTRRVMQFLPQTLDPGRGGRLTERFIDEFGDDQMIASGVAAHFWSGGWSGPRSLYLERKRDAARRWLSNAKSSNVQSWVSEFISALSTDIESAKIQEERGY